MEPGFAASEIDTSTPHPARMYDALLGSTLMVTESSRLDRRDDLDAQAEILLGIRSAGGDIISIAEPQFGKTDFAGRIVTLVAQHANAEKSKTVKQTTYRGISMIIANNAHHGPLPSFWVAKGERYAKQAYCTNPEAVRDIYKRVANCESLLSIARGYDLYPASIKNLVRFAANHTGAEECRYTHEGVTGTWAHEVTPVVESPLWWRANKVLAANVTDAKGNKGGRPVAQAANWISGILGCPLCGAKLHPNAGLTGVRLWIGPGGGSPGCPRGPVTLRGCSCGAGRDFALADPLRFVRSACGVRCWRPRSARDWPGRPWPRCPGHAGVPARRAGAGPGGCAGQAAGGAFGCCDPGVAGRGSRCRRVAAGTTSLLLRVLTFLMVKRG